MTTPRLALLPLLLAACAAPTGGISGRVTVTGATTSEGIQVSLTGPASRTTTTAADGSYALEGLPVGTYALEFSTTDTVEPVLAASAPVSAGSTIVLEEREFTGLGRIEGHATFPDHAGVTITVTIEGTSLTTTPGTDGAFAFGAVSAGKYVLRAVADGAEDAVRADVEVTWRGTTTLEPLILAPRTGSIASEVRVVGSEDRAGVRVWVVGRESAFVESAADGTYTLAGVPVGDHELHFERGHCAASLSVRVSLDGPAMALEGGSPLSLSAFQVPCATHLSNLIPGEPVLSPTGTHVVIMESWTSPEFGQRQRLYDLSDGSSFLVEADTIYVQPGFTPDGARLFWYAQYGDDVTPRGLWSSPVDHFAPTKHLEGVSEYQPQFCDSGRKALVFVPVGNNVQAGRAVLVDFVQGTTTTVAESAYFNGPSSAVASDCSRVALFDSFDRSTGLGTSLRLVDVAAGTSRVLDAGIHLPYAPAFSRDDGLLVYFHTPATGAPDLRITSTTVTAPPRTLVAADSTLNTYVITGFFSASGDRLIIPRRGGLSTVGTDGTNVVAITPGGRNGELSFGTTDGRWIVTREYPPGGGSGLVSTVRVVDFLGEGRTLFSSSMTFPAPTNQRSADGSRLLFSLNDPELGDALLAARADGSEPHLFAARLASFPALTPDGSVVAYTHKDETGAVQLRRRVLDTNDDALLDTDLAANVQDLKVAADGLGVVYARKTTNPQVNLLKSVRFEGSVARAHLLSDEFPGTVVGVGGRFLTQQRGNGTPYDSLRGLYLGSIAPAP